MKKDAEIFFEHILECIDLIERYTKDCNKKEFMNEV